MANLTPQLHDYRLTTAKIFYHMPDHVYLLQEYVWQDYDLEPKVPALKKFLQFWTRELDGKLHSVYLLRKDIITPGDYTFAAWEGILQ